MLLITVILKSFIRKMLKVKSLYVMPTALSVISIVNISKVIINKVKLSKAIISKIITSIVMELNFRYVVSKHDVFEVN
jgi:hypothetical protein